MTIPRSVLHAALFVAVACSLVACAPARISLRISPVADPQRHVGPPASFVLVPAEDSISEFDLLFREYAAQVASALEEKGYRHAKSKDQAAIVINMDYGVSNPIIRRYTYSVPVYPTVHYYYHHHGHGARTWHYYNYYGYGYGYGYYTTHYTTSYESMLELEAFAQGDQAPLWSVYITAMTGTDDLRELMPYLVAGSYQLWGADSKRALRHSVEVDDPRVEGLRMGVRQWTTLQTKRK